MGGAQPVAVEELRGLRVLIVDDNEVNRRVLRETVTTWGMRERSVGEAERVLTEMRAAHASGDPYQFVLLDYQMPEIDGGTLAGMIKADPDLSGTQLIMLTSVGHLSDVKHMEGVGIEATLVKPVRQSQLLNSVLTSWSRKSGLCLDLPPRDPPDRKSYEGMFTGYNVRVLLAEDNVVNQKVASRMLERIGIRADVASNGSEAVEMNRLAPYDIILMDCQMPEMDGYAASREIRRLEGNVRHTVIIAMTAEAITGAREQCLAAGMDDYIAKPVQLHSLTETLREWAVKSAPRT
jgi:CheY-like chemotaxis protein